MVPWFRMAVLDVPGPGGDRRRARQVQGFAEIAAARRHVARLEGEEVIRLGFGRLGQVEAHGEVCQRIDVELHGIGEDGCARRHDEGGGAMIPEDAVGAVLNCRASRAPDDVTTTDTEFAGAEGVRDPEPHLVAANARAHDEAECLIAVFDGFAERGLLGCCPGTNPLRGPARSGLHIDSILQSVLTSLAQRSHADCSTAFPGLPAVIRIPALTAATTSKPAPRAAACEYPCTRPAAGSAPPCAARYPPAAAAATVLSRAAPMEPPIICEALTTAAAMPASR